MLKPVEGNSQVAQSSASKNSCESCPEPEVRSGKGFCQGLGTSKEAPVGFCRLSSGPLPTFEKDFDDKTSKNDP